MKKEKMIAGKRYRWLSDDGRVRNALFTGKFDEKNGNALLMTKNGDSWSIPPKILSINK